MAETVKGINIQIGSNLTQFDNDVKALNSDLKFTDKQLKNVNTANKWDRDNISNYTKKQELLTSAVQDTTKKLTTLKQEQDEATEAFAKGEISRSKFEKITVETGKAEAQLAKYNKQLEYTNKKIEELSIAKLEKLGESASKAGATLTTKLTVPIVAAVGSLAALTSKTVDTGDEIAKSASKIAISSEALQEWRFVAERSGVSTESLEKSFSKVNLTAGDLATGVSSTATQAFDTLGVSITDVNGKTKDTDTLYTELISSLNEVEDQTIRTSLANDIFGEKTATELTPILNQNATAISDLRTEKEELGVITNEQAAQSEMLADKMTNLKASFSQVAVEIATSLYPIFEQVADVIQNNLIPKIQSFSQWFANISDSTKIFAGKLLLVVAAIGPVLAIAGKGIGIFTSMSKVLGLVSTAVKAVGLSLNLATAGIGLLVGLVIAAAFQSEEFKTTLKELTDAFMELLEPIFELVQVFVSSLKPILNIIIQIFSDLMELLMPLLTTILTPFIGIIKVLASVLKVVFQILSPLLEVLLIPMTLQMKALSKVFSFLIPIITKVAGVVLKILIPPFNLYIKIINYAIEGINKLISLINKIPGIDISGIDQLDNLSADQLSLSSESGSAVSSTTTTNNVSNSFIVNNELDVEDVANKVNIQLGTAVG